MSVRSVHPAPRQPTAVGGSSPAQPPTTATPAGAPAADGVLAAAAQQMTQAPPSLGRLLEPDPRADPAAYFRVDQLRPQRLPPEPARPDALVTEPNLNLAEVKGFKWLSQFDPRVKDHGETACFRACQTAMRKAGIRVANVDERIGVACQEDRHGGISVYDREKASEAVRYVDEELQKGHPVCVGVTDRKDVPVNADAITDHFVVITGKKTDEQGRLYYEFRDPGTRFAHKSTGRLYPDERGILCGDGPYQEAHIRYEVSMVRTNEVVTPKVNG